ncbi:MAG: hypothetical protein NTZ56_12780 [Acidobacteria bacterium]|nr:hypothetical protein [Acidobacteriota bacterium]
MTGALHYVDLAIAFSLVMLLATTLVMTLAQIGATLLKQRQTILQDGIASMLQHIGLTADEAKKVAQQVMAHSMAQAGGGEAIQREQLVRILLDLARDNASLRQVLGTDDPAKLLEEIRATATKLEEQYPHLAEHVRHAQAILGNLSTQTTKAAAGIHRVMNGFDTAAEAMSQTMATHARFVTIALSFLVALLLPLDSITILKKLSTDSAEVDRLVTLAAKTKTEDPPAAAQSQDLKSLNSLVKSQLEQLTGPPLGIVALANDSATLAGWGDLWWKAVASPGAILGILLSTGLMSLGAPFWFDALKNLFRLRPMLAQKESGERAERAAAQPSPSMMALTVAPGSLFPGAASTGSAAVGGVAVISATPGDPGTSDASPAPQASGANAGG